ncbi:hypothetical protein AD951_09970 [Acetobacter malorum]|uniref:Uncharacterized protein n=1 Tax=Acetobacter malorum TaxID=178901 RepID=A0A149UL15_9PROT|nr:hypothetical protein [Acetobacter malorum]KXV68657.1 hypothetical protein AD951_09970 [Acetobacter malorum]
MSTLLDFSAGVAIGARGNVLSGGQIVDAITNGAPVVTHVNPDTSCSLSFAAFGKVAHRLMPEQAIALSLTGGIDGQLQEMLVMVQQTATGNASVTLPESVIWHGQVPFIDTRAGAITFFLLWSLDGGNTVYGRAA